MSNLTKTKTWRGVERNLPNVLWMMIGSFLTTIVLVLLFRHTGLPSDTLTAIIYGCAGAIPGAIVWFFVVRMEPRERGYRKLTAVLLAILATAIGAVSTAVYAPQIDNVVAEQIGSFKPKTAEQRTLYNRWCDGLTIDSEHLPTMEKLYLGWARTCPKPQVTKR